MLVADSGRVPPKRQALKPLRERRKENEEERYREQGEREGLSNLRRCGGVRGNSGTRRRARLRGRRQEQTRRASRERKKACFGVSGSVVVLRRSAVECVQWQKQKHQQPPAVQRAAGRGSKQQRAVAERHES